MSFFFSSVESVATPTRTTVPGSDKNKKKGTKMSLEKLRKDAKDSMGEVEDLIPKRISEMKLLLEKDKDLVPHPASFDEFYLRCIRSKKYDLERAAKLYRKFCQLRMDGGEDFFNKKIALQAPLIRSKYCSTLKTRDDLGRQFLFVRMEKWDSKDTSFDDVLSVLFLLVDEMTADVDTQLFGFTVVIDLETLSVWHASQMRPGRIRTILKILQDSYPARFKEFHILNNPSIFSTIFSVASLFMKEKMRKRVHFHGTDINSLHTSLSIDPQFLPEFVGGTLSEEEYNDNTVADRVLKKDDYYKELLKYGYVKNSR